MTIDFDWQVSEEGELKSAKPPRLPFPWRWLIAALVLLAMLGGAGWWLLNRPLASDEEVLQTVQLFLDLEQRAVVSDSGETFRSLQTNTKRWTRAQRLPFTHAAIASGQRVVEAELVGGEVWATVEWEDASGEPLRRAAFFEWRDGNLLHTPPDQPYRWADYWGEAQTREFQVASGRFSLQFFAVDAEWANEIVEFVDNFVQTQCAEAGCLLPSTAPLVIQLTDGYALPATDPSSRQLTLPSPRVIGITASGDPAPIFWQQLRDELTAALRLETIRFGVPPELITTFRPLAANFEQIHPRVQIELVDAPSPPDAEFFASVDGAYLPPRAQWIEQGWIQPLDDLAALDMSLNITDFYPVALDASAHQTIGYGEQLWMLPQSIEVPVIYFDERASYFPKDGKEWETFITRAGYQDSGFGRPAWETWGYADSSEMTLHSYAMSAQCIGPDSSCLLPLNAESIEAAQRFSDFLGTYGATPDFAGLSELQRKSAILTLQSPPRRLVAWLDRPSTYEHNGRFAPIGVMALPGVEVDGSYARVVPLDVRGGVISAASEQPQMAWAWLKFLSERRPIGSPRQVPARASVAREISYWTTLPQPLRQVVGESFVDGRAILIAERGLFEE